MATVIDFPGRHFVRFFDDPIMCDTCGHDTPGHVYEGSGMIVCHVCDDVILHLETEREVVFIFEDDDGTIQ